VLNSDQYLTVGILITSSAQRTGGVINIDIVLILMLYDINLYCNTNNNVSVH
jgi:hypothetical protein